MANKDWRIETVGMKAIERQFEQMTTPEPIEYAKERLDVAGEQIFAETQLLVPEGAGDKRRPAGSLRDSGRFVHESDGDEWNAEIQYGTDDDALPYAVWARWKAVGNGKPDFMAPTEDPTDKIADAMNAAFDDVFGE